MRYSILVLGTSNSILRRGWVAGLRQALPDALIENASVGASPGIQFSSEMQRDFTKFDVVFFDSLPNDEAYQLETPGFSDKTLTEQILFEIFSTISSQTRLVIVGITNKTYLDQISLVFLMFKRLATLCGAQFFDTRQILLKLGTQLLKPNDSLYEEHVSHPQSYISRFLGFLMGREIYENPSVLDSDVITTNYSSSFKTWRAESAEGKFVLRTFSNSLTSQTFAILQEGQFIEFDEPGLCIGIGINIYSTSCYLCFRGSNTEKHLRFFFEQHPNGFMRLFIPVPGGAEVTSLIVGGHTNNETFVPRMSRVKQDDGAANTLAISHACFWHSETTHYPLCEQPISESATRLTTAVEKRATKGRLSHGPL